MRAYQRVPFTFPTYHDTDDAGFLDELIALALEPARGGWIGIGLKPPRTKRVEWMRRTLERIPPTLHVHLWAGRRYIGLEAHGGAPIGSVDSTNWFRDSMKLRQQSGLRWLSIGECLDLVVMRYLREPRMIQGAETEAQMSFIVGA